jgi:hypothetical protein
MKSDRNLWPLGIVTAFVLLFCGIATVLVIAATHRERLVSDNYYENELRFQSQIDAANRAQKAGAAVHYDSASRRILLALPAAQAKESINGKISFYRASAPELDREFPIELRSDGTQELDVSKFVAGPWQIRVRWTVVGLDYYLEQKMVF